MIELVMLVEMNKMKERHDKVQKLALETESETKRAVYSSILKSSIVSIKRTHNFLEEGEYQKGYESIVEFNKWFDDMFKKYELLFKKYKTEEKLSDAVDSDLMDMIINILKGDD